MVPRNANSKNRRLVDELRIELLVAKAGLGSMKR
jgi:hypothetical protein